MLFLLLAYLLLQHLLQVKHQQLLSLGISIAEREVTHLMHRYEKLVSLHVADRQRLVKRFRDQKHVLLAIDGLQPDVGHEVL